MQSRPFSVNEYLDTNTYIRTSLSERRIIFFLALSDELRPVRGNAHFLMCLSFSSIKTGCRETQERGEEATEENSEESQREIFRERTEEPG